MVKDRVQLDDLFHHPKPCYTVPALEFKDERIHLELPKRAVDIEGYE